MCLVPCFGVWLVGSSHACVCVSHSVISYSLWPHGRYPTRLISVGFSRQEYWSGLSFPSPEDFPTPGNELRSPALQVNSLPSEPPGKPITCPNTQERKLDLGLWLSVQLSSVTHSCSTLCNPLDCSTPGLPVHHQLPEFTQTHVHHVGDAIQPSHPLSSPSPPSFNLPQHQGLFKWVSSSHEVAKVLEFQLQHQSFQWTPRTDLLQDGLVGSPCSPRDSQDSVSCE